MNCLFSLLIACYAGVSLPEAKVKLSVLPQNHDYQVTLRTYMETLTEADFEIELQPLSLDIDYFSSEEELFRTWILFRQAPPQGPVVDVKGITVNPVHFTLSSIESENGIMMGSPGRWPWIPVETMAWWAGWDYDGNPYFENDALKKRAFVYCAVDMMMLDEAHENGKYTRSDYLGASLAWMAYTYYKIKDTLPQDVQNAYETGLLKFFRRLEEWGPRGTAADMDQFAHIAMWYTAQSIGDDDLKQRARKHSRYIISQHFRHTGYIDHGDGFDPAYNGISLDILGWAALAAGYDFLFDALDKMSRLKAHLTLPEPDGHYYGPSHFSTATSKDSPNDLRGLFSRDIAIGMVTDHAKYLLWEGRMGQNTGYQLPDQDEMLSRISLLTNRTNGLLESNDSSPGKWEEKHWTNGIIYAYDYYRQGFYEELKQLNNKDSQKKRLPYNRDQNFIQKFPDDESDAREQNKDEFLTAKMNDYGLVIHTGRLSWWGGTNEQSGFGGGAISAFWTEQTGSVILGRIGGFQGPAPDTWDNWKLWPTHAISGKTVTGEPFSSARYRYPVREYRVNETDAAVAVYGVIGNIYDGGRTTANNGFNGRINYSRNFEVKPEGLTITSTINTSDLDGLAELYEIVPIFLGGSASNIERSNTKISFLIDGTWSEPEYGINEKVQQIRIRRHQGEVYVEFLKPQHVMLSPDVWKDDYQSNAEVRNIMIDFISAGQNSSGDTSIQYRITPGK